jgi:hypothetical protein
LDDGIVSIDKAAELYHLAITQMPNCARIRALIDPKDLKRERNRLRVKARKIGMLGEMTWITGDGEIVD